MSSAETPDDREPPEFSLYRWSWQVAAAVAATLIFGASLSFFYEPRSPEQKIKDERRILELICGGKTVRLMSNEDIEACKAAGIDWPPRARP